MYEIDEKDDVTTENIDDSIFKELTAIKLTLIEVSITGVFIVELENIGTVNDNNDCAMEKELDSGASGKAEHWAVNKEKNLV